MSSLRHVIHAAAPCPADVKRAMIEASSEVYLVADSTKFGKASLASLGGLELVDVLVTDSGISESQRELCESRGLKVVVAP